MQLRFSVAILLSAWFSASFGLAQSHSLDVSGVSLNMSLDQAKAKIGSGFQERVAPGTDPAISFFVAWKQNEGWALETINNKVVYLAHSQRWTNPDTMPLEKNVSEKLQAKFGGNPNQSRWGFDQAGNAVAPDLISRCDPGVVAGNSTRTQVTQFFPNEADLRSEQGSGGTAAHLYFPTTFAPKCPIMVVHQTKTINTTHSDTAITLLIIDIGDFDAMFKETAARNVIVNAQKGAADSQRNAKRQTAPM